VRNVSDTLEHGGHHGSKLSLSVVAHQLPGVSLDRQFVDMQLGCDIIGAAAQEQDVLMRSMRMVALGLHARRIWSHTLPDSGGWDVL
jgi:hypothetical protein